MRFPRFKPNPNQRSMGGVIILGFITPFIGIGVFKVYELTSQLIPLTVLAGLIGILILVAYWKSGIMEIF